MGMIGVISPLHQLLGAECAQFVPTVDGYVSVDVCFRTPVVRLMRVGMHAAELAFDAVFEKELFGRGDRIRINCQT